MRVLKALGLFVLAVLVLGKMAQDLHYQSEIRERAINYIECEDNCQAESTAVRSLGSKAVHVLSDFVIYGPPAERLQAYRQHLEEAYDETPSLSLSRQEYVQLYLGNYIALYQIRSAKMLGQIGGPQAKRALERALQSMEGEREDVRAEIQKAIFLAEHQTFE